MNSVTPSIGRPVDAPRSLPVSLEVVQSRLYAARPGRTAPWPDWLPPHAPIRAAVAGTGVSTLWAHQAQAAEALRRGRHVVLTTGTASGKSLAYLLPLMAAATEPAEPPDDPAPRRRRPATSLYLAPTKALAHDQARVCAELGPTGWRVATVDGDTDPADRRWARDHAQHVLTNPDLLHASLLPQHQRWASFLRSLRYVVVDEAHRYRGGFGGQVAAVLRRLRRVAAHYGADPTFAVLSATVGEGVETAAALTGIGVGELLGVDDDGSARGPVRFVLARSASAPTTTAAELLAGRVSDGEQALVFVPSRRAAEEVARAAAAQLGDIERVVAYRAGYLAADRRAVERGLADGTIRGVAATTALELGVDIAGLDTVVLCGYPGSRAAFWQQAGRAGRRGEPAEVVLIGRANPLDAYLLDHPEALFDAPVEASVLDPESPPVLGPQLAAAAQELPLRPGDERWFGNAMWALVERLTSSGLLRRRPDGWYWTAAHRAVDRINLRSADPASIDIVEEPTGRVLGTVDRATADLVVHPGAVYLHQGETYLTVMDPHGDLGGDDGSGDRATDRVRREPDPGPDEVFVRAARPGYLTQPLVETRIEAGPAARTRSLGRARAAYGRAQVRTTVTGFLRRDELSGEVWDSSPLACPERVLSTTVVLLEIPAPEAVGNPDRSAGPWSRLGLDAGVHALEHLLVGMLSAIVASDRTDVGAQSWVQEDGPAMVAVFDRQPGSGYARRAYECADAWLAAARDRIDRCRCDTGCPACILAPGCGSTRGLDKAGARRLLVELEAGPAPS